MIYTLFPIFTIGYTINNKPFETMSDNLIEIINESFIFISGYFLIIFSEWIYDPSSGSSDDGFSHDPVTKYNYGYVYILFVLVVLGLNLSYVLYE